MIYFAMKFFSALLIFVVREGELSLIGLLTELRSLSKIESNDSIC